MAKTYNEQVIRNDYKKLTETLREKNISITTMESCTSGQIASLITDTEGASGIMKGAFKYILLFPKENRNIPLGQTILFSFVVGSGIVDKLSVFGKA